MKYKIFMIIFITLSALLCMAMGCETEGPPYYVPDPNSPHCVMANIKGSVYENPSGKKIPNVPIEVAFVNQQGYGIITYKVCSEKTDKNGDFNIEVLIDTTSFYQYDELSVNTAPQSEYIISRGNTHIGTFRTYHKLISNPVNLSLYKKTIMTIKLHKTTDCSRLLYLDYIFGENLDHTTFNASNQKINTIKTIQFPVAADIPTQVRLSTLVEDITVTDTLTCKQNQENIINLKY